MRTRLKAGRVPTIPGTSTGAENVTEVETPAPLLPGSIVIFGGEMRKNGVSFWLPGVTRLLRNGAAGFLNSCSGVPAGTVEGWVKLWFSSAM